MSLACKACTDGVEHAACLYLEEPAAAPAKPYEVLCISMYHSDVAHMDELVARLKAGGWGKANRSHLLRLLLQRVDDATIAGILAVHGSPPRAPRRRRRRADPG